MSAPANFFLSIRPHRFFLLMACCFGTLFLLVDPPFQVPDEMNHFYKAYQISEGHFISVKQDNRVGGTIPNSLEEIVTPFVYMCWDTSVKTSVRIINETLKKPLNRQAATFMDFPNTAMYSPVCYAPQAAAIFVLRLFDAPALVIFYGARLFTLLCWIFGMYTAIRLMPVFKWMFTFLALLPMSVFVNMSLSADVMTNLLSFLFIAVALRYAYDDRPFTRRRLLILCGLAFLLVSAKLVYMSIILLVLLIPAARFLSLRDRLLKLTCIAAVSLITAAVWSSMMSSLYTPYAEYNVKFRDNPALVNTANMHEQKAYILSHGTYIFKVFRNSLDFAFDMYYRGYIGTFGWLEVKLPLWLIHTMYLLLLLAAITDGDPRIRIGPFAKAVFAVAFLLALFLMLLSQHLTWDPVGGEVIATIQGRYLIPFMPLLFLLFYNRISAKQIVVPVVIIGSLFALIISFYVMYARYFGF